MYVCGYVCIDVYMYVYVMYMHTYDDTFGSRPRCCMYVCMYM
jgi:hypothetical protein